MLFVLLIALTSGLVHEFVAESNWVCTVCEESLKTMETPQSAFLLQGQPMYSLEDMIMSNCQVDGETFSTACTLFIDNMDRVVAQKKLGALSNRQICISMNMCEDEGSESYQEFIKSFDTLAIDRKAISDFNHMKGSSWKMGINPSFVNFTLNDIRKLLGTIVDDDHVYSLPEKRADDSHIRVGDAFDPRDEWPQCKDVIGHIRDQSACGSCWAFGSTEAYNDRRCIQTNDTTMLSADDTTACCGMLQCSSLGCNGGQPTLAWRWFTSTGVVTGGDYGDTTTCLPYAFPACSHHVDPTPGYPACPDTDYNTPTCSRKCTVNSYDTSYSQDKHTASDAYSLRSVNKIMSDIKQYGSATAAFTVYEDFVNYKSGVYSHVYGRQLGGHAIKMVGWGVEDGEDYWLIANSWNPTWGDQGYFKIKKGSNECGIEGQVSGGVP